MKRLLIDNSIEFEVLVSFIIDDSYLAATTIDSLYDAKGGLDPQSYADYCAFVDVLTAMIDYYGFEIVHSHPSKTSFYYMFARKDEIAKNDVPYYVYLRVSDHEPQHKKAEHIEKIRDSLNKLLEENKKPSTKKRQRYRPLNIIINDEVYDTYEEAARGAELILREWMKSRGIDISDYQEMWTD